MQDAPDIDGVVFIKNSGDLDLVDKFVLCRITDISNSYDFIASLEKIITILEDKMDENKFLEKMRLLKLQETIRIVESKVGLQADKKRMGTGFVRK